MKPSLLLAAQIGFVALTFVYFYFFLKELRIGVSRTGWDQQRKSKANFLIILVPVLLAVFVSIWSLSGIMADFSKFPLNFAPVLVLPFIVVLYFTFSRRFTEVLKQIPTINLVRLQTFRFFVEILLWMLFINGSLPEQMSFEGRNFDILAGITAIGVAWLIKAEKISKTGLVIWNIACLGLLINIVTIAILSTPTPLRVFFEEPSNTIVTYFPVSWLPGLLVPLAYTLHFFSLKQLAVKTEPITQPG